MESGEASKFRRRVAMSHRDLLTCKRDFSRTTQADPAGEGHRATQADFIVVVVAKNKIGFHPDAFVDNRGPSKIAAMDQEFRPFLDQTAHREPGPNDLIVGVGENSDPHFNTL